MATVLMRFAFIAYRYELVCLERRNVVAEAEALSLFPRLARFHV